LEQLLQNLTGNPSAGIRNGQFYTAIRQLCGNGESPGERIDHRSHSIVNQDIKGPT